MMNLTEEALKIIMDLGDKNIFVIKTCDFSLYYSILDELKNNTLFYVPNTEIKYRSFKELYESTDNLLIDYIYNLRTKSIILLYEQFIQIIEKIDFKIINSSIIVLNNNIERYKFLPINEEKVINKIATTDINEIQDEEIDYMLEYYDDIRVDRYGDTQRVIIDYKDKNIFENLSVEEINLVDTTRALSIQRKKYGDYVSDNSVEKCLIYLAQDLKIYINKEYYNRLQSDILLKEFYNSSYNQVCVIANPEHFDSLPMYLNAWCRIFKNIILVEYDIDTNISYEQTYDIDLLLKKYWNSNKFREYCIYDIYSNKYQVKKITQKEIIMQILSQYVKSKSGNSNEWKDIFFIASTGAGKSLLYQLPSIILNDENRITIVVSPLKALMKDQLQTMHEKGLTYATYINSDVSYSEQIERLEGIKNGKYSLIYVSPEFLQKYSSAKYLVGDRKIGLVVVDEAHCVSTWGKDFRADYGYLGDYIKRYRKEMQFPILALTATAVWGGEFDTLNEIIGYLNLMPAPIIYYTDIKRTNVDIEIKKVNVTGNYRETKIKMTIDEITKIVKEGKKAIVYFPWKSQIKDIYIRLSEDIQSKVAIYTGDTKGEEGEEIISKFKSGEYIVVLATKAFGMGIDISDIEIVYHHAIPGNLADYSQEIGRAGRNREIRGKAYTLFNQKDFQYWRILKGISRPTQWELKLIVNKLYDEFKYGKKKRLQKLLPLDTFSFVFNENEVDNTEQKIRTALFLIEKDFFKRFGWNIISVYPRDEFGNYYCTVDDGNKDEFINKYGKYVREICNIEDNIRFSRDKYYLCKDIGNILEIDLKKLWEEKYYDKNYRSIKYLFFNNKLFEDFSVIPRIYTKIELQSSKEKVLGQLEYALNIIATALQTQDKFTKNELEKSLRRVVRDDYGLDDKEIINKLLHICTTFLYMEVGSNNYSHKMIIRKRDEGNEYIYIAPRLKISLGLQNIIKIFNNRFEDGEIFEKFLVPPYIRNSIYTCETLDLAYILETMGLASFIINGGHMPYVNIVVNSVDKLATAYYKNQLLMDMRTRDDNEIKIVERFINTDKNKWDYIEDYFLGRLNI